LISVELCPEENYSVESSTELFFSSEGAQETRIALVVRHGNVGVAQGCIALNCFSAGAWLPLVSLRHGVFA
jgi:hypothetical protein